MTVFTGKEGEYFQFGKEKFLDEAKRLSAFQDEEGIVHVYDCFSANETAYLVMEYLDGITLSEYLKKESAVSPQGRIAPEKAIAMLTPIMLSLQRVHDSGMIHRDIAPDNIYVTKAGKRPADRFRCCAPCCPRLRQEHDRDHQGRLFARGAV